jgi:superfamily II DNA/RNA helicase
MPRSRSSFRDTNHDKRFKTRQRHELPILPIPPSQNGSQLETIGSRLERIEGMGLEELQRLVEEGFLPNNIDLQEDIISRAMKKLLNGREPRYQQVRSLRRLVYRLGDTMLIAKTGFGKTIIFQAYSILTGKITIQLIPLCTLGKAQVESLNRFEGVNAALITADTKDEDPALLQKIRQCEYTHILLGAEQAASSEFRAILLDPELKSRIGLVAIDECHVIDQWKDFRSEFTLIYELRRMLSTETIYFACSATVDRGSEQFILEKCGFYAEGNNPGDLEIIRTSIDRPDISICICSIPAGKATTYELLGFLLKDAVDMDSKPTPLRIPKAVIFIDGLNKVKRVAEALQAVLVRQYRYPVELAVRTVDCFTSLTPAFDQNRIYNEFEKSDSYVRICSATTSLGMGIDIPDIEAVIQWDIPTSSDIKDLWQRIGRAVRKYGLLGIAALFVPYWMFDRLGYGGPPAGEEESNDAPEQHIVRTKRRRHQLKRDRAPSGLQQAYSHDTIGSGLDTDQQTDASETESHLHDELPIGLLDPNSTPSETKRKKWSKEELKKRRELPSKWASVINAPCHRRVILNMLQEARCDPSTRDEMAPSERCCNGQGCNPDIINVPEPKPLPPVPQRSRDDTAAGIALHLLEDWLSEKATAMVPEERRWMRWPADVLLESNHQWAIARAFNNCKNILSFRIKDVADLAKFFPLDEWEYKAEYADLLVQFLRVNCDTIVARAKEIKESKKRKRAADDAEDSTTVGVAQGDDNPSSQKARDNGIAYLAAIKRADPLHGRTQLLSSIQPPILAMSESSPGMSDNSSAIHNTQSSIGSGGSPQAGECRISQEPLSNPSHLPSDSMSKSRLNNTPLSRGGRKRKAGALGVAPSAISRHRTALAEISANHSGPMRREGLRSDKRTR